MKKVGLTLLVVLTLSLPHVTHAQFFGADSILGLLAQVQQQIDLLRAQLSASVVNSDTQSSTNAQYRSAYYGGPYLASYGADGYGLSLQGGDRTPIHQMLWNMFVDVTGEDAAKGVVTEFRIYRSSDSPYAAFIDPIDDGPTWLLAVNLSDIPVGQPDWQAVAAELFLHEYGHLVTAKTEGLEERFTSTFWSNTDTERAKRIAAVRNNDARDTLSRTYYGRLRDEFVSDYALTSANEDVVESFTEFVMSAKPQGNAMRDKKVAFFYQYPSLIELRDALRTRMARYVPLSQ